MTDSDTPSTTADDTVVALDPGNTDPVQLVAPLDDDDDATDRLAALIDNPPTDPGTDSGDDEPLGY